MFLNPLHSARMSLCAFATIAGVLGMAPQSAIAEELVLTEPVHGVSFLPVYVAQRKGYFKDEGVDLKLTTMAGAAFVNAVISGEAFAFLGSVDHNAFARNSGPTPIRQSACEATRLTRIRSLSGAWSKLSCEV
jgi:NitT/TauT family transport system substrate-binding protein